ncbi:MAG: hypothetical protein M3N68_02490 [Actinomycetota bacterium]|nr:hypothetical protein [Actinomycetota bacterium]
MSSREALVLRAFAAWTVYVWGTRIWNVVDDESRDFAFKAVHVVLALVSVAFAVAAWVIVSRNRRRDRADREAQPTLR